MSKEIVEIFKNEEFGEITTIEIDDEIWFLGKEVAKVLGYSRPQKAINDHVDFDDKKRLNFKACPDLGLTSLWFGNDYSDKTLINESGLYSLVLSSKLESAKSFKRWVTKDILPSIRRNGMYATDELLDNPDLLIAAATKLKEEREKNKRLEQEKENLSNVIASVAPTVEFAETILESNGTLTPTQIAADYGMSAKELNKFLHNKGVQYKSSGQWILYAKYKDKGYVDSRTIQTGTGTVNQTLWTQKGRKFIHELLACSGISAVNDIRNKQIEMEM